VLEDARDLETLLALERTKRLKERKVKPLEDQESKLAHACIDNYCYSYYYYYHHYH
jgi:hypothetical protein